MNLIVRWVYILALAGLLTLFLAVGVATFYPGPEAPEYPRVYVNPACYPSGPAPTPPKDPACRAEFEEERRAQEQYDREWKVYEDDLEAYHRDVFIIADIAGIAVIIAAILLRERLDPVRTGLLLGGLFILVYGMAQGFEDMGRGARFIAVAVALVALLYVGYRRLLPGTERPAEKV